MKPIQLLLFFFTMCSFANVSVINGLTHVYSGVSGDTVTGEIILVNYSSNEERVTFDVQEALYSCTRARVFTRSESHPLSSSSWLNSSVNERVLAPKERYVLKFTIAIPEDDGLRGSYWSVLMVSVEKPIKEVMIEENIGIGTKIQYAIGLITNVNSPDEVTMGFADVLSPEGKDKNLQVKVRNDGRFAEATSLSLEVYDSNGIRIKEYKTKRLLVFPDVCRDYLFRISDLDKGTYDCVLVADAREAFFGTDLRITID